MRTIFIVSQEYRPEYIPTLMWVEHTLPAVAAQCLPRVSLGSEITAPRLQGAGLIANRIIEESLQPVTAAGMPQFP